MRDLFGSYYRPTEPEFKGLWSEATFVVDTNVLLNLYRYSEGTRNQLLNLLQENRDKLWLPHQVAREYMRGRLGEIHNQRQKLQDMREYLHETVEQVESKLDTLHRDSGIEAEDLLQEVRESFQRLLSYIGDLEESSVHFSNSPEDDEIWAAIDGIFAGKIGDQYPSEREQEIFEEGKKRYDAKVPPGYKDAQNHGTEQYGDLIIWLQIIDKAKVEQKPIIFITDDTKEDWWWKSHGHTLGPRRELLEEMGREANVPFYMYTPERFLKYARISLGQDVSDETIAEVQKAREREEAEAEARRSQMQEDLLAAWSALTGEEQDYARRHFYAGRSAEEIAEDENLSVQEVDNVLLRASSKIRQHFEEREGRPRSSQVLLQPEPAEIPSPEQIRRLREIQRNAHKHMPSEREMQQLREIQENARKYMPSEREIRRLREIQGNVHKHMPSEREMQQLREMQRLIEQQRKGLGI